MTEHPNQQQLEQAEAELWARVQRDLEGAGDEQPDRERIAGWLREVNAKAPWLRVVANREERAVVARSPRSRALRWSLLAAVASLCGVGAAFQFTSGEATPAPNSLSAAIPAPAPRNEPAPGVPARSELVLASGAVTVDGDAPNVGREPLVVGQRIATAEGRACLTADPDVDLCLAEHSEIRIASLDPKRVRFEVVQGAAVAQLSPMPPGHSFVLTAGDVEARAVGTVYQLTHDPAQRRARVSVLAGKVDVAVRPEPTDSAVVHRVPAHMRLDVNLEAATVGSLETLGRVEESPVWTQLAVTEWWSPPEVGLVEIRGEDVGVEAASIDGGPALALPIHALLPLGRHRWVAIDDGGKEHSSDFEVLLGQHQRVAVGASTPTAPKEALGTPSPASMLERARELRRAGRTQSALAAYASVRRAHPRSPEAHTVLITMGKIQLELGQPDAALSSFDTYLRGSGALAPEALGGKVAALRALGRTAEERAAIEEYLRRFPRGFLAPRFEQRLQSLR